MSEANEESALNKSKNSGNESGEDAEHDPYYDPIISLPEVEVPTLEEDEIVMLNLRAKLYRYDSNETPPEWKERGTGTVKILRHKTNNSVRVVMRRDKTLKLCANHFISPFMNLKPSASCERAWVYSVKDYSDATVKSELLAIKFANVENAHKWKEVFEEAKQIVKKNENNKGDSFVKENVISEDKEIVNESASDKQQSEVSEKLSAISLKETEASS